RVDTVRNGRQYKVQAPQRSIGTLSTTTTGNDDATQLTLPPTSQRLGRTERQVKQDEYRPPAIRALRHDPRTSQHWCYDRLCHIIDRLG
ncbi:Uncharacterized protein FWK35_00028094, partial [Aphis craccivora]